MTEEKEREGKRLQVLVKDGESVRRVLWISMNYEGISAGYCLKGQEASHWTYHSDGSLWFTGGDNPAKRIGQRLPLNELKGYDQFITLTFPADVEDTPIYPPYREKTSTRRLDGIYYVDSSLFVHGGVACTVYVVEPHEAHQLASLMTRGVAHVFTQWIPWVAIVFSHVKM